MGRCGSTWDAPGSGISGSASFRGNAGATWPPWSRGPAEVSAGSDGGRPVRMSGWSYAGEPAALGPGGVTLVEGSSFCVCEANGDIREGTPQGVFFQDTRIVSGWRLKVDQGAPVEPLAVRISHDPWRATFVGRAGPAARSCREHPAGPPGPLRGPGHARRPRGGEPGRRARRGPAGPRVRRRLRRPVRGQGEPGRRPAPPPEVSVAGAGSCGWCAATTTRAPSRGVQVSGTEATPAEPGRPAVRDGRGPVRATWNGCAPGRCRWSTARTLEPQLPPTTGPSRRPSLPGARAQLARDRAQHPDGARPRPCPGPCSARAPTSGALRISDLVSPTSPLSPPALPGS